MSDQIRNHVEAILAGVSPSRRSFLRNLLLAGGAVAALALPASQLLAAEGNGGDGKEGRRGDE